MANAILLALVTGQRREDVSAMTFDQAKDGFLWIEQKKTGAKLLIPMTLRLDAIGMSVADVLKQCRDSVISKRVIHFVRANSGRKPGDSPSLNTLSAAFAEFRDLAKIQVSDGKTPSSFHEIRSLPVRLYTDQYGPDFAQALTGHRSASMTALYRDSRGREWSEATLRKG
ncbi:integrase [Paraburkholderia sp. GAS334]